MKIFESNRGNKVNFVDDNNVFVGYDLEQNCCESAGYYFKNDSHKLIEEKEIDLHPYAFDIEFFEEGSDNNTDESICRFRLKCQFKPDIYLYLSNTHNGYYSHGFESTVNGKGWHNGML